MFKYMELYAYYTTNLSMTQEKLRYKISLTELENMYPFERDLYITLINKKAEEK